MENSHLGSLPGEIRNMIYQDLLQEPEPVRLYINWKRTRVKTLAKATKTDGYKETWGRTREIACLSAVCRTMLVETRSLYLALNQLLIFTDLWSSRSTESFLAWLKAFGYPSVAPKPQRVRFSLGSVWARQPDWQELRKAVQALHPDVTVSLVYNCRTHPDFMPWPRGILRFGIKLGEHQRAYRDLYAWLHKTMPTAPHGPKSRRAQEVLREVQHIEELISRSPDR